MCDFRVKKRRENDQTQQDVWVDAEERRREAPRARRSTRSMCQSTFRGTDFREKKS